MRSIVTDLPFKVNETAIVIVKAVPVFQCDTCREYVFDDPVWERVETILERVDTAAELEIVAYAA
jgi:YgiT-type zinc finger domain-containing protein